MRLIANFRLVLNRFVLWLWRPGDHIGRAASGAFCALKEQSIAVDANPGRGSGLCIHVPDSIPPNNFIESQHDTTKTPRLAG